MPALPVKIAEAGLRYFLEVGTYPDAQSPPIAALLCEIAASGTPQERDLLEQLQTRQAGTFVSFHTIVPYDLRGCIGTLSATQDNILEEILQNTVGAGVRDSRFFPITLDELSNLTCKVDILGPREPIESMDQLDVKRYGVIVSHGWRSGLLLPDLEGVNTVEFQVSIALDKAGISPSAPYTMERFEVIRYV